MLSADPTASLLGEYQSVSARSITSVLLNLLWRGINYCPRRPGILQLKQVLRKGHFLRFKQARVPCLVKGELQTPGDGTEMLALLQQGCWAGTGPAPGLRVPPGHGDLEANGSDGKI